VRHRRPATVALVGAVLLAASAAGLAGGTDADDSARLVRSEFLHAWSGYRRFAWGHDELKPLSKAPRDWHEAPLLMTPVDAMDTMILMGLSASADSTRDFVARNLSFDHDFFVKNFEITIRILGGLLSTYQLCGDQRLLDLAIDLGNRLSPAFDSPTGFPYMFVNLRTGAVRGEVTNPAEIGTLLVEFGALSKLSGKPEYFDRAKRALLALYERRSPIGLVGSAIHVETGAWVDSTSHISGGIDSYYEYLLKCARLFDDADCERMWRASVDAVNRYLAHETPAGLWYAQANMFTGKRTSTRYGALDAFFPAVLALSGDLDRAARLQNSSHAMWNLHGIEPEEIDYSTMTVTHAGYPLRPEIAESAYYLYGFTKNERYREMGRVYLAGLMKHCRTAAGYAALNDVTTKEKRDNMESFFLAETLKYLYLLFAPPETVDLSTTVFNTEAHPIRKDW
jgi:mannosidase alpha-like ER degradation enhancer 2